MVTGREFTRRAMERNFRAVTEKKAELAGVEEGLLEEVVV